MDPINWHSFFFLLFALVSCWFAVAVVVSGNIFAGLRPTGIAAKAGPSQRILLSDNISVDAPQELGERKESLEVDNLIVK